MQFNLTNINLSNPNNTRLYDELTQLDCLIDTFLSKTTTAKTYHYDFCNVTVEKIRGHLAVNIQDLQSDDSISCMAIPVRISKN